MRLRWWQDGLHLEAEENTYYEDKELMRAFQSPALSPVTDALQYARIGSHTLTICLLDWYTIRAGFGCRGCDAKYATNSPSPSAAWTRFPSGTRTSYSGIAVCRASGSACTRRSERCTSCSRTGRRAPGGRPSAVTVRCRPSRRGRRRPLSSTASSRARTRCLPRRSSRSPSPRWSPSWNASCASMWR